MDFIHNFSKTFDFAEPQPSHFMDWIRMADDDNIVLNNNYEEDCKDLCEYSCLFMSMLLCRESLEGEMYIVRGKFDCYGHYWMVYELDGKEYYLDLTLLQFYKGAPKLAITLAKDDLHFYNKIEMKLPIMDYVQKNMAFSCHADPTIIYDDNFVF